LVATPYTALAISIPGAASTIEICTGMTMPDSTIILFFSHRKIKKGVNNTSQIFAHYFSNSDAFLQFSREVSKIKKQLVDDGEEEQQDGFKFGEMVQNKMMELKLLDTLSCKPVLTYLNNQRTDTEINLTQAFQLKCDTGLLIDQSPLNAAVTCIFCHHVNNEIYDELHQYNNKDEDNDYYNEECAKDLTNSSSRENDNTIATTTPPSAVHNNAIKKRSSSSSTDDMGFSQGQQNSIARCRSKRTVSAMGINSKETFIAVEQKKKKTIKTPAPAAKKKPTSIRSNEKKTSTKKKVNVIPPPPSKHPVIKTPSGK
jgi:hypothetical protein